MIVRLPVSLRIPGNVTGVLPHFVSAGGVALAARQRNLNAFLSESFGEGKMLVASGLHRR